MEIYRVSPTTLTGSTLSKLSGGLVALNTLTTGKFIGVIKEVVDSVGSWFISIFSPRLRNWSKLV